jgi:N-formylglutamate amidohydrolase
VATAVHAGHDVRPEIADLLALGEDDRLREEDPYTERLTACAEFRAVVSRSRFEVDLNRSRAEAVYLDPEQAWGLGLWRKAPSSGVIARSLDVYDSFYADLGAHLDQLAASGPFVVFDLHSYNHRRDGPDGECAPQRDNPDVNLGTGSMGRRWRPVADAFIEALGEVEVSGRALDVRENVRFTGRQLARWVHERYPSTGCALAIEFKKTFMDEWTGAVDVEHLDALTDALRYAVPPVLRALGEAA